MRDVAEFLFKNKDRFAKEDSNITIESLEKTLQMYSNNIIVSRIGDEIVGVLLFYSLSDDSFNILSKEHLRDADTCAKFFNEKGDNYYA